MKRLTLTWLATLALAIGAYAQGTMILNNEIANNAVTDLMAGNYYTGTYGLQVWELSPEPTGSALATLLSGINGLTGLQAYNAMMAAGFKIVTEFDNQRMSDGSIMIGQFESVYLPAGNIVLGLVAWNTGTTFAALPATAHVGALAFPQQTVNLDAGLPPTPPDLSAGWNSVGQDLVMVPIPEPGALALAVLGLAALLIFRLRR